MHSLLLFSSSFLCTPAARFPAHSEPEGKNSSRMLSAIRLLLSLHMFDCPGDKKLAAWSRAFAPQRFIRRLSVHPPDLSLLPVSQHGQQHPDRGALFSGRAGAADNPETSGWGHCHWKSRGKNSKVESQKDRWSTVCLAVWQVYAPGDFEGGNGKGARSEPPYSGQNSKTTCRKIQSCSGKYELIRFCNRKKMWPVSTSGSMHLPDVDFSCKKPLILATISLVNLDSGIWCFLLFQSMCKILLTVRE